MTARILLFLVLKRRIKRFKWEISCSKTQHDVNVSALLITNLTIDKCRDSMKYERNLAIALIKKKEENIEAAEISKIAHLALARKSDIVRVVKFLKSTFQKQNICKPYNPQNLYISRIYRFRRFRSHVQPASGVHINRHVLGYRLRASQTMTTFHAMIVSARRKSLIHATRILDDQTRERTYAFVRKKRQT